MTARSRAPPALLLGLAPSVPPLAHARSGEIVYAAAHCAVAARCAPPFTQRLFALPSPRRAVSALALSADGALLAAGADADSNSTSAEIYIWEFTSAHLLARCTLASPPPSIGFALVPRGLAFSADALLLAACCEPRGCSLASVPFATTIALVSLEGSSSACSCSSSRAVALERAAASGSDDAGVLRLVAVLHNAVSNARIARLRFSPFSPRVFVTCGASWPQDDAAAMATDSALQSLSRPLSRAPRGSLQFWHLDAGPSPCCATLSSTSLLHAPLALAVARAAFTEFEFEFPAPSFPLPLPWPAFRGEAAAALPLIRGPASDGARTRGLQSSLRWSGSHAGVASTAEDGPGLPPARLVGAVRGERGEGARALAALPLASAVRRRRLSLANAEDDEGECEDEDADEGAKADAGQGAPDTHSPALLSAGARQGNGLRLFVATAAGAVLQVQVQSQTGGPSALRPRVEGAFRLHDGAVTALALAARDGMPLAGGGRWGGGELVRARRRWRGGAGAAEMEAAAEAEAEAAGGGAVTGDATGIVRVWDASFGAVVAQGRLDGAILALVPVPAAAGTAAMGGATLAVLLSRVPPLRSPGRSRSPELSGGVVLGLLRPRRSSESADACAHRPALALRVLAEAHGAPFVAAAAVPSAFSWAPRSSFPSPSSGSQPPLVVAPEALPAVVTLATDGSLRVWAAVPPAHSLLTPAALLMPLTPPPSLATSAFSTALLPGAALLATLGYVGRGSRVRATCVALTLRAGGGGSGSSGGSGSGGIRGAALGLGFGGRAAAGGGASGDARAALLSFEASLGLPLAAPPAGSWGGDEGDGAFGSEGGPLAALAALEAAVGLDDGSVDVIGVAAGCVTRSLRVHAEGTRVAALAFSPLGTTLFSAGCDGRLVACSAAAGFGVIAAVSAPGLAFGQRCGSALLALSPHGEVVAGLFGAPAAATALSAAGGGYLCLLRVLDFTLLASAGGGSGALAQLPLVAGEAATALCCLDEAGNLVLGTSRGRLVLVSAQAGALRRVAELQLQLVSAEVEGVAAVSLAHGRLYFALAGGRQGSVSVAGLRCCDGSGASRVDWAAGGPAGAIGRPCALVASSEGVSCVGRSAMVVTARSGIL